MTRHLTAQEKAVREGSQAHFIGPPCPKGHDGLRYVSSGKCVQCNRDRANARRIAEPDAVREEQAAYRALKGDTLLGRRRELWAEGREATNATRRAKTAAEPGHRRAQSAAYYERHRERVRQRQNDPSNRERFRGRDNAISKAKKARKLSATPAWADAAAMRAIYEEAAERGLHVDHIIPLQGRLVCGLHVENNLQLLPPAENIRKRNKFDPATHTEPLPAWATLQFSNK